MATARGGSGPSRAADATPPLAPERLPRGRGRTDASVVADIAARHFGERPRRIGVQGGGLSNAVFRFRVSSGEFILRSHVDATRIATYLKEHWSMDAARAVGVPVARVLEVGNLPDGRAYMIQEAIGGIDGRKAADRLGVLEQLGRLAARLHRIRTHGYGPVFDWSGNRLSRHAAWADYLDTGLRVDDRVETLLRHRMIDAAQARTLRATAREMAGWKKPPVLHHGDLRLKNVLVDPAASRVVALVDWDGAVSHPGPYWDLSLALHELGVDEKEALLGGYGLKASALEAAAPFLRCFNTLNYAHPVSEAARSRDRARLAWFRLRLAGALDLYERRRH